MASTPQWNVPDLTHWKCSCNVGRICPAGKSNAVCAALSRWFGNFHIHGNLQQILC